MDFFMNLAKQHQSPIKPAQTKPKHITIYEPQPSIENLQENVRNQESKDTQDSAFQNIRTLLTKERDRTAKKSKTLKDFRQKINTGKQQIRPHSIVCFIEPQFLVRTLFQEHSHALRINQIKFFSTTKKGLRNFQTLENQDYIVINRIASIFKYFCIFDGHGQYGKIIAETAGLYFKSCIKSFEQEFKREIGEKQITGIIKNCLKKTQLYLHNAKFNEIQYSGTTALIVVLTPRSIITFNIGNSRCVIGMKPQSGQNFYDFQVTHDHDLNRLDERIRVKKKGAVITPLKDELGENFGPDRLWNKNEKRPGTFITRALGLACGSKAGIISDPQISILSYNHRMKFLVLASDGLWTVEENDQVVELLQRYYNMEQLGMGIQMLIQEAIARWKSKVQLMDDISIIVIGFPNQ